MICCNRVGLNNRTVIGGFLCLFCPRRRRGRIGLFFLFDPRRNVGVCIIDRIGLGRWRRIELWIIVGIIILDPRRLVVVCVFRWGVIFCPIIENGRGGLIVLHPRWLVAIGLSLKMGTVSILGG